ncbi:hypothetical protein [Nocardioides sp. LS1]|uniref:hypothetical protein n=1 Tax=Nocardioides sp. LS1 TaxID=1027620 RepID=UPI000F619F0A|nr:hypothetical protein [Nocardioides sp. LS1]GCD90350.1 hypothetical protein NLS1_23560 [Nocardioides sp. LS1]
MRRALALVALLLATGCTSGHHDGPDGPDPGADPDRAAIHDGLATLFAGDHPTAADVADGDCFARELTARVTPAQLRAAGVLDESYAVVAELPVLDQRVGEAWVQAQFACVDYVEAAARAAVSVSHGAVDPGAYAACLRAALSEDELHDAVLATLTGSVDGPEVKALSSAQSSCTEQAKRN